MSTRGAGHRFVGLGLLAALVAAVTAPPARAQNHCTEPVDPDYQAGVAVVRQAVDREDFVTALAVLEHLATRYDYAVLDYSRARALHRMQEFAGAEGAYSRFLHRAEGCPAAEGLVASAREYRALAVRQQVEQLSTNDPPGAGDTAAASPAGTGERDAIAETVPPARETFPLGGDSPSDPGGASHGEPRRSPAADPFPTGWVLVGAGAALVVAGIGYDIARGDLFDEAEAARDANDFAAYRAAVDDIDGARLVDAVLYGGGIAVLGVGLAILVLESGEDGEPAVGVGWREGLGLSWRGTW